MRSKDAIGSRRLTRREATLGGLGTLAALTVGMKSHVVRAEAQGPGVTDTEIRIGAWHILSGPLTAYGIPQRAGDMACISLQNDRGGVAGRKITYIAEDYGFDAQRAIAAARKLITRDQVLALVGGSGTSQSVATFPYVLDDSDVPFLNYYGGTPEWYKPPRKNLFGVQVSYEAMDRALGPWAAADGHKKLLVLFSSQSTFEVPATSLAARMKAEWPDVSIELYPVKFLTQDYGPIALDIIGKKPDAIVAIQQLTELVLLAKSIHQQGQHFPIYTDARNVSEAMLELGGEALEGLKAVSYTNPPGTDTPAIQEYRDALAKYSPGEKPDFSSLVMYGAMKIFIEAVRRIDGPINRPSLLSSLLTIDNFETGILPPVTYNLDRHLGVTAVVRLQVSGGKWIVAGDPIDTAKDI
jgi:branched-chain amino acid transport system substrate-binding protein